MQLVDHKRRGIDSIQEAIRLTDGPNGIRVSYEERERSASWSVEPLDHVQYHMLVLEVSKREPHEWQLLASTHGQLELITNGWQGWNWEQSWMR